MSQNPTNPWPLNPSKPAPPSPSAVPPQNQLQQFGMAHQQQPPPPPQCESPNNIVQPSMMTNNAAVVAALQGKCDFPNNKMLMEYTQEVNRRGHKLEKQPYYVGMLNADDVAPYLKKVGDFGVHACDQEGGQVRLMLTVRGNSGVYHFDMVFDARGRGWNFHPMPPRCLFHKTVIELVDYHRTTPLPTIPEKICLRDSITRPSWFLKHDNVTFDKNDLLGKGNFCEGIYRGKLDRRKLIAVKVCRANWRYTIDTVESNTKEKDAREALIKEGSVMSRIRHPNVITFYGICCDHPPIMIALEVCPGNSLVKHLIDMKAAISVGERIKYLYEAASGMSFLEKNELVHRDLAARNCLISKYGKVKIADFGLSKLVSQLSGENWNNAHIPVSFGEKPWPDWENKKIATYIRRGQMMELPNYTPPQIKALVSETWKINPAERPDFGQIFKRINEIQTMFPAPRPQLCTISKIKGVTVLSAQEIEVLEENSEDIQIEAAVSAMSNPQPPTAELPPSVHGNVVDKMGHVKVKDATFEEADIGNPHQQQQKKHKKKKKTQSRDATRDTHEENLNEKQQSKPKEKEKKKKKKKEQQTSSADQTTLEDGKESRTVDDDGGSNNTVETDNPDITQDKLEKPSPKIKVEKMKRPPRLADKHQGQYPREPGVKSKPEHGKKRRTTGKK
uniref:Non-specific protein-tyrosine kinase n=1 Tax=Panagrolaimus sp. ES5 TaxID=591445 RepID=A0AC34FJU9_9BILA